MQIADNYFRDKVYALVRQKGLNKGHIEACLNPLKGYRSISSGVRTLLQRTNLTAEEYVDYFVKLQGRQAIK